MALSWLSKTFELDAAGFNWPRAVTFSNIALVPLVIFWAIGYEQYLLSALFGLTFSWLADPETPSGLWYQSTVIAALCRLSSGRYRMRRSGPQSW